MLHSETQLELIIPDHGYPFKLFMFEGNDGHYVRNMHWHKSIEIFAIFEGELDFYINDDKIHLVAGEFIIINSNELHSIHAMQPNFTLVLQIPYNQFKEYIQNKQFILFTRNHKKQDKKVMNLLKEMFHLFHSKKSGYDFKLLSRYYSLLSLLVTSYTDASMNTDHLKNMEGLNRLSPITAYLEDNYDKDISLKTLARTFGYTAEHLSRMFIKYARINFKAYLQNVRLEYARNELAAESTRKISEIASLVGFSDSRAMEKAFKKQYGILPNEYRKQIGRTVQNINKML